MARFATLRANERSDIILQDITRAAEAGEPCPSVERLSKLTGLAGSAIYRHILRLSQFDYIAIVRTRPRVVQVNALGIETADPQVLRVHAIAATVANVAGLSPDEVAGRGRALLYVRPRVLVCHFAHSEGLSFSTIGRALGRDHSTIVFACSTVTGRLERDRLFRRLYERAEAALAGATADLVPFVPAKPVAALPGTPARFEIGEDGELQAIPASRRVHFDPMLAALKIAHPERFAA